MSDSTIKPGGGASSRYYVIPEDLGGKRLDVALAHIIPDYSRSYIKNLINNRHVVVDEEFPRPRDIVHGGEQLAVTVPATRSETHDAQPMEIDIVYRDESLLVVDKPAGMVVHPGAGNPGGTLLNGLLHLEPSLASLPRAGIVHRLDKLTSGLMVVARGEAARLDLVGQLAERTLTREYLALVVGQVIAGGSVDEPVGRDPRDRRRMTVTSRGREAVTHYRVARRFRAHTLLRVTLATGRTHQIRVHMRHIGCPLLGDPVYGGRLSMPAGATPALQTGLRGFKRQALHATRLGLRHPATGEEREWQADAPPDMRAVIDALAGDTEHAGGA